jgi:hypothetical protein
VVESVAGNCFGVPGMWECVCAATRPKATPLEFRPAAGGAAAVDEVIAEPADSSFVARPQQSRGKPGAGGLNEGCARAFREMFWADVGGWGKQIGRGSE